MIEAERLDDALNRASRNRSRLVFFVGADVSQDNISGFFTVNLNKTLPAIITSEPRQNRAKLAAGIVRDHIAGIDAETVLVTGVEILFDRTLSLDPVRLLKDCSRQKTLLVHWPGDKNGDGLSYAILGHPEYRTYKRSDLKDIILVEADDGQC